MSELPEQYLKFLKDNKISLSSVFDATGLKKQEYRKQMKALGCEVAVGVAPCKKSGHRLRSRAGHCVMCDSSKLAFQSRYRKDGVVYLVVSKSVRVLKVGCAGSADERVMSLNSIGYAGANDWKLICAFDTKEAGAAEFAIHGKLKEFLWPIKFLREEKEVTCRETFRCDVEVALVACREILPEDTAPSYFSQDAFTVAAQLLLSKKTAEDKASHNEVEEIVAKTSVKSKNIQVAGARKLFDDDIYELERKFNKQKANIDFLKVLKHELSYRKTSKARRLNIKVERRLELAGVTTNQFSAEVIESKNSEKVVQGGQQFDSGK